MSTNKSKLFEWRILLLVSVSFLIYSNTLFNSFVWVDHTQIIQKEHIIQDFDGLVNVFLHGMPGFSASLQGGYYRPIINLSYSIDYWIWGLNPLGFHLTNVLLHTLVGVLLFLFLHILLRNNTLAFLISLLFVAHPIHTEPVAWVSGRADMIFTFFYLLAFLFHIRQRYYFISGLFFFLALLSKEMAITLPLIVILFDICFPLREGRYSLNRALRIYTYYFGILAGFLLVRFAILGGVGSGQSIPGNSYLTTFYTTSRIFVGYIWQLVYPVNLAVADVVELMPSIMDPTVLGAILILTVLALSGILLYRSQPFLTFCIYWFFISLIPVSNFVPALHLRAERFLYLPSIAFSMVTGFFLWGLYTRVKEYRPPLKYAALALSVLILILYSLMTFDRNFDWKDDVTIFSDAIRKKPLTREAYVELGSSYRDMGNIQEAEKAFISALPEREGYASFVQPQVIHKNLRDIYIMQDEPVKAIKHLLWLSLYYRNDYTIHRDLGLSYLKIGRPDWANIKFRQGLLVTPDDPKLRDVFRRAIDFTSSAAVQTEISKLPQEIDLAMVNIDLDIARRLIQKQ